MIFIFFILILHGVLSDDCIKYTFDEDFWDLFVYSRTPCSDGQGLNTFASWYHESYANSTVRPPNEKSEWFISPSTSLSCISSFPFWIEPGGTVEVNVYIDSMIADDHLTIIVHKISDGVDPVVGTSQLFNVFDKRWHVIRIPNLSSIIPFHGYVSNSEDILNVKVCLCVCLFVAKSHKGYCINLDDI